MTLRLAAPTQKLMYGRALYYNIRKNEISTFKIVGK